MAEAGHEAVRADEEVVPVSRIRELGRLLGRKTMETEILREAIRARLERIVLLPIPDANARTAALRSNQVDWIEAPAPDAVPQIRQRGFNITQNLQPHVWPWQPRIAATATMLRRIA